MFNLFNWIINDWLVVYLPLWKIVSWADYSQYLESHKIHVPKHQADWALEDNLIQYVDPNAMESW